MQPKKQLILEYNQFFNEEPPLDRISFIKHIPKIQLIYEIAGLNYRLKPCNKLKYDYSFQFQINELKYFCANNNKLYNFYASIVNKYTDVDQYPIIFNRATNLFALEEIINNTTFIENENFEMNRVEVWDGILKYLLSVNSEVVKFKPVPPEEIDFEKISINALVLNELNIEANPLYTIYRGICLIKYLLNNSSYKDECRDYFDKIVKLDKDEFIYRIISLIILNSKPNIWEEFVYYLKEPDSFLEYLSQHYTEFVTSGRLITIKKAPFFKENNSTYVLLDNTFLFSKCYDSFINDFWFNYLKKIDIASKSVYSYKHYRSDIGYFFEDYVETILTNSFKLIKNPGPLCFKALKINSALGQIELADIYVRIGKRILVGQVKSGSIYDNEKYSGDIDALYRHDRENFFRDFGVNQTLESIKLILKEHERIDLQFPKNCKLEFFPILVLNENLFQTPLLPSLLNIRFKELLASENFDTHIIHPLVTIHVSDLEYIENKLSENPDLIYSLLYSVYDQQENNFIPPFYSVIGEYINEKSLVTRAYDAIDKIRSKYSTATS